MTGATHGISCCNLGYSATFRVKARSWHNRVGGFCNVRECMHSRDTRSVGDEVSLEESNDARGPTRICCAPSM